MKTILILHNPGAGEEDHQKDELVKLIKSAGYHCDYVSLHEKSWKNINHDIDVVMIVGGDGTVRQVVKFLLKRRIMDKKLLVSLLPMGTANNIALTLGLSYTLDELVSNWENNTIKKMDIGAVYSPSMRNFFIEGLGYGLLPKLMKEMEGVETDHLKNSEDEISFALHTLLKLTLIYKAKYAAIEVDGQQFKGNFLLVEIMNICSVGPNLRLAPKANISDGLFEVVLLHEEQRDDFVNYIKGVLVNKIVKAPWQTIRGKQIQVQWGGGWIHVDDELIRLKKMMSLQIEARPGILEFLL